MIKGLPPESEFWQAYAAAEEAAQKPSVDKIRERQAHYAKREG